MSGKTVKGEKETTTDLEERELAGIDIAKRTGVLLQDNVLQMANQHMGLDVDQKRFTRYFATEERDGVGLHDELVDTQTVARLRQLCPAHWKVEDFRAFQGLSNGPWYDQFSLCRE
jgi:hypothetical protein